MKSPRQDLSCIVSKEQHWAAAKHVLTYLRGTVDLELCFRKTNVNLKLIAYSDSNWAADQEDRQNVTG